MHVRSIRNNRGAALVVVLFLMVFGTALVMLLSDLEIGSYKFVSYRGDWMLGQRIAEAGMAEAIREVNNDQDFDASGGLIGSIAVKNFNGGTYNVTASEAGGVWTLTSTATYQNPLEGITRVIEVVLTRPIDPLFGGGAFSTDPDGEIELDSNALVDSYDSADGPYDKNNANENGHIGTNGDITLDGNATVKGDATTGPDGTLTLDGNNSSVSGSTTPATEIQEMQPVQVPPGYETWVNPDNVPSVLHLGKNSTLTLPPGNYHFAELSLDNNAVLNIIGPATIVISGDDLEMDSNSALIIDATAPGGGHVDIYLTDSSGDPESELEMDSNTIIRSTTYSPTDITIFVHGKGEVELDSNVQIYAGIYAPNSEIELDSNSEIFGAVVGSTIELDSNAKIHFDEQLLLVPRPGAEEQPMEILSWRVVQ